MTARRKGERIEPSFGIKDGGSDVRVSADDRAVTSATAAPARRGGAKAASAAPSVGADTVRRGGFFGHRGRGSGGGGSGSGSGSGRGAGNGRPPRRPRGFLAHIFRLAVFACLWGAVALAVVVGYFAIQLPSEAWSVPDRPPNVKIVSVNGELLANRGLTGGEAVSLDQISPYVPQAVIAIEDRRFYDHLGVDPVGIVRAFTENMAAGATVQGGSTLTQQLAKNVFLNPEQTFQRKAQEAILSVWLEQKFTKDQILEMYLNRVYFGSGATGIEAAARRYFNKSARELDLSESALLAGLLKAPSRLTPLKNPESAKERAGIVLQAMLDEKMIEPTEFEAAKAEKSTESKSYWNGAENYAADIVMRDLQALVGEVTSDVVVETTIDLGLEKDAERSIRETIDAAKVNVSQGALVAIDGTGAIRALVGGHDYAESQFNRAVDAKRQPGSTFKPFVYQTALEYGWRPDTMVNDAPTQIGDWTPSNYDRKFRGAVTLSYALAHSLNTIAAQLTAEVGAKAVIETASRMGVKTPLVDNASIALGTSEVSLVELTGAFAPFANGGYQATPHLVNRVTDVSGKVLYERGAEVPPVIVTADIVGAMNAMLTQTITSGTGRKAAIDGWQAAGKTGTTQEFKDAWFVGYTANLTTGVWFGNDNGAPMKKVTGGGLPAEAWHSFMAAAHEGLPAMPLPGDYRSGEEQAPLTASTGAPDQGGFYDNELPAEDAIDPLTGAPAFDPATGEPDVARSADPYAADPTGAEIAPRAVARQEERPRRREMSPEEQEIREVYREREPVEEYGFEPLPGDDGYDYYDGGPVRGPDEIAPARGPSRIVRQAPPPGAILEGPVESGRASDRSLFRDFFGG